MTRGADPADIEQGFRRSQNGLLIERRAFFRSEQPGERPKRGGLPG